MGLVSRKGEPKMADERYDDRALSEANDGALPKPQIQIIVDGKSIFKPGMKTYFVEDGDETGSGDIEGKVVSTSCRCDTVVSTHLNCTCESVSACSCVSHTVSVGCPAQGGGTGGTVCTCQAVSCGSPCACIPVYY